MSEQYVILAGNPIEGFEVIGPFIDWDTATEYAVNNIITDSWLMSLQEPRGL